MMIMVGNERAKGWG